MSTFNYETTRRREPSSTPALGRLRYKRQLIDSRRPRFYDPRENEEAIARVFTDVRRRYAHCFGRFLTRQSSEKGFSRWARFHFLVINFVYLHPLGKNCSQFEILKRHEWRNKRRNICMSELDGGLNFSDVCANLFITVNNMKQVWFLYTGDFAANVHFSKNCW